VIVYRHIRLDKNEPFYIGIGSSKDRAHRQDGRNDLWNKIVSKTDYKVQIVFEDLTKEEACKKEIELIALYGRLKDRTGTLSNITSGGESLMGEENPSYNKGVSIVIDGKVYTSIATAERHLGLHEKTIRYRIKSENFPSYNYVDEDKKLQKLSYEQIEKNKTLKNGMLGKNHSSESKEKMSKNRKGRKMTKNQILMGIATKPNRREVFIDGVRYMSIAHAANELGVSSWGLSEAISKKRKCKGIFATYADGYEYTKEIIEIYLKKYGDNMGAYPQPAIIAMLKELATSKQ
jgi:hypothetical protein